jgi:hypothetical protein
MAERRSSLKAPTPVRTALLRCMCCVKNGEVEKLREENRQLRAEVRFQHAKQGDAVDTRRGVASLSMALDMAPPEVPPMVAPSPPSRYFGTAVALVAVGCLAALAVAATDMQVHPLVLIGASALLGAGVLVALLPPAPPPPPVPPSASKARRKRHSSMRRISAEVVEGMAYRAASIVVDDGTKRSLPEVVMSRVTEGALTDEVVQCKLDSTQAPSKRLSVTRLTRRSMTRVSTEALPPGAQHFVGEWTFVEQEHCASSARNLALAPIPRPVCSLHSPTRRLIDVCRHPPCPCTCLPRGPSSVDPPLWNPPPQTTISCARQWACLGPSGASRCTSCQHPPLPSSTASSTALPRASVPSPYSRHSRLASRSGAATKRDTHQRHLATHRAASPH